MIDQATKEEIFDGLHVEFYQGVDGGQGHPLLFVHGAWTGSWIFTDYLAYLPQAGWNCYAMNLRGHYKSPAVELGGMTQWDYARDVMRIARRLPQPPIVIGFGTGAHLIQLALSKGMSAVGAVFISAKLTNRPPEPIPAEVRQMPHLLPAQPLVPAADIDPNTVKWINQQMERVKEPRSLITTLFTGETRVAPDFVNVPYLVLNGEHDDSISTEQSRELADFFNGQGTLDIVHNTSHEGILVGYDWREGASAINSWLFTNGFNALQKVQPA